MNNPQDLSPFLEVVDALTEVQEALLILNTALVAILAHLKSGSTKVKLI